MLDRKTKDRDASVELLEDRARNGKIWFFLFFLSGWMIASIGVFLTPTKYDELVIGLGICLLIFATWGLILIVLKKDKEK